MIPRMKKPDRKLVLRREVVQALTCAQLSDVRGGGDSAGNGCPNAGFFLVAAPNEQ